MPMIAAQEASVVHIVNKIKILSSDTGNASDTPERMDHFFLPDFCAIQPVLLLIIFSQLLSITFVLVREPLFPFPWTSLAIISTLVLWITLTTASFWCSLRERLMRWPEPLAAVVCFAIVLLVTLTYSVIGQWIVPLHRFDWRLFDPHWSTTLQHIIIAGIIGGLILRYFYLSGQLEKQRRSELLHRVQALQSRIQPHFLFNSEGGRLVVKVLGKDFSVDISGKLSADIHINPWVAVPFLDYIRQGKGLPATGNWLSFRELKDGKERYPLFQKRCEVPLKQVADTYTDLFDDLVRIFGGKQVDKQFESDISVVLHPLPRVPIMICYWLPEDGLESSLNLYFDDTADQNLTIGSVFSLGAGLSQMFGKLALRHGFAEALY